METDPLHTFGEETCKEIADLINRQNSLISDDIHTSPLTQLYGALKVWKIATQCEILAKIITSETYFSDEPKEKKREELTLLLTYLRQIRPRQLNTPTEIQRGKYSN